MRTRRNHWSPRSYASHRHRKLSHSRWHERKGSSIVCACHTKLLSLLSSWADAWPEFCSVVRGFSPRGSEPEMKVRPWKGGCKNDLSLRSAFWAKFRQSVLFHGGELKTQAISCSFVLAMQQNSIS